MLLVTVTSCISLLLQTHDHSLSYLRIFVIFSYFYNSFIFSDLCKAETPSYPKHSLTEALATRAWQWQGNKVGPPVATIDGDVSCLLQCCLQLFEVFGYAFATSLERWSRPHAMWQSPVMSSMVGRRPEYPNHTFNFIFKIPTYSRTPLIQPPSESHWCGRIRGMVAREGFVYKQKALSVIQNVVVWEGWSLVRVVVRQGFYCTFIW